ncbi:MAG: hypothetical protein ACLUIW_07345 [Dysosmobacter welbionis]
MIQAVIFDWAGTTVDYGCFAPVQAFQEAFAHHGVPVTLEETRKPMGMLKRDHIRTMLRMERIARAWEETHGRPAGRRTWRLCTPCLSPSSSPSWTGFPHPSRLRWKQRPPCGRWG